MKISLINKKNYIVIALAIIVIATIGGWYALAGHDTSASYIFIPVKKGDLTQEIKAGGTVKAAQEVNLSFERGGRVKVAGIKVGDQVKAGQVLAELDNSDMIADLSQSNAGVEVAVSQLKQLQAALELQGVKKQELLKGARPEDLQISQTKVDNTKKIISEAQTNLDNVKSKADMDLGNLISNIDNLLQDAYAKAFDSVSRQIDGMFTDSQNNKLAFDTPLNPQMSADAEIKRMLAGQAVNNISGLKDKINPDNSNYEQVSAEAISQLEIVRDFLSTMNSALNYVVISSNFSQAQLSDYKVNISNALNDINATIAGLNNYKKSITAQKITNQSQVDAALMKVNEAKNSLSVAEKEFDLKKAGATKEQLAGQNAILDQAQANLETQRAQINAAKAAAYKISTQLDKTIIKAPIDGTITKYDLKVGEEVLSNSPVIGVMTMSKFQVEVYIPESEVSDIKIGDEAQITLDAYGDQKFQAGVALVDPAATISDGGVSSYKVILEFIKEDAKIKPGLTANVKILAQKEKNIIIIPEASVIKDGYDNYVIVYNGTPNGEKRKIELGGIVQNSFIGVKSGLTENDKIADFLNNTK